jgi:electron transfer flavoprotein alpha subunit
VPCEAEEGLTLGRRVSAELGAELRWLVLGPIPEAEATEVAGRHGATVLDHIADPALAELRPDLYVEALARYCAEHTPKLVLFNQTFDARLVAPRLAARLGAAIVTNGVGVEASGDGALQITASAYGGDTRVVYALGAGAACVVTLIANAVPAEPAGTPTSPSTNPLPLDLGGVEERIRVVERARTEGPRLEDAETIVAGGRGLGSPENYKLIEELADALGGLPAASRPLVDDGWVDSSRQVGLTGKITRPGLYLAVGISGASQHMAGCSAAKTIAAINTDSDAAIFRYARYGIVGDCHAILPELIRAAKQTR